ncbi:MAG: glycosyltransferase [Clostridiales bacterium]|nr:glycosyltransferase [Clostridiales bacterium]
MGMRQPGDEKTILVSICCIAYNQAEYIRDALEGFVTQRTNFAYEVLIHDDASTDGTAEIIKEYARRYPEQIFPILQTENQYSKGMTNISGTFNFPRARGRYIAMCEGDDYWTDADKLQKQVDFLEAHPHCSLCFHSAKVEVQGRAFTERMMRPYRGSRRVRQEEIIDKTSGYPTASLMFRRKMVEQLPDFYVQAPIADIPLQLLAAERGWAYYMDEPMCVYRLGGTFSWTNLMKKGDYERKQREYAQAMERMYRGFDERNGGRFHDTVAHAVRRLRYLTWVNTKQFSKILAAENRGFYRELNLRTRFFIRLEAAYPGVYRLLQGAFHGTTRGRK